MSLGRKLRRLMEDHGVLQALDAFNGLLADGSINPRQVSFRDIAENVVGHDYWQKISAFNAGTAHRLRESTGDNADHTQRVLESGAGDAVDSSAFADITGQLLINEVRRKFKAPTFIGDMLMEKVPITNGNLGEQKTPWLSDVLNTGDQVQQGMPYPHTKFVQQYQTYPAPEKFGEICSVTMEMIYSDLTSQAMDSAGSVGRGLGYLKEQKQLKVALGITNNFNFMGTARNTYVPTTPAFTNGYVNELVNEFLVDWTNINNAEQMFSKMVDPATGRRIFVEPKFMVVPPALKYTAKRVVNATETRSATDTTADHNTVIAANPLDTNYSIVSSSLILEQLIDSGVTEAKSNNYWWLIDPFAFVWREVYDLRTESAPKGNPMEFHQDIAVQVKAGWYGVAAVRSPWHAFRSRDD